MHCSLRAGGSRWLGCLCPRSGLVTVVGPDPVDINTAAPVITRDEILIHAPIQTVWDIQTDVAEWPSWQPDVDGAQLDGPLAAGSVFRWQTAGLHITSTVAEIDEPPRIVWGGPAQGIVAVHVWTLDEQQDGVLVRTEESWEGDPVDAQVEMLQAAHDGVVAQLAGEPQADGRRRHVTHMAGSRLTTMAPIV
jgi:uncharacterized protein YndB with AHSA1/START domain